MTVNSPYKNALNKKIQFSDNQLVKVFTIIALNVGLYMSEYILVIPLYGLGYFHWV